jgi:hypothetical protein
MSSKFITSVTMPSWLDSCEVEQYEEDLDDRDPERSGGEPGLLIVVVIACGEASTAVVNDRREQGLPDKEVSNECVK